MPCEIATTSRRSVPLTVCEIVMGLLELVAVVTVSTSGAGNLI